MRRGVRSRSFQEGRASGFLGNHVSFNGDIRSPQITPDARSSFFCARKFVRGLKCMGTKNRAKEDETRSVEIPPPTPYTLDPYPVVQSQPGGIRGVLVFKAHRLWYTSHL